MKFSAKVFVLALALVVLLVLVACMGEITSSTGGSSSPGATASSRLTVDEARAIYDAWLDGYANRQSDFGDKSEYTLNKKTHRLIELQGKHYYWFQLDGTERYWFNILVHMETGELLYMDTPDGPDPVTTVQPLEDWFNEYLP
jgi:hypothetical protein